MGEGWEGGKGREVVGMIQKRSNFVGNVERDYINIMTMNEIGGAAGGRHSVGNKIDAATGLTPAPSWRLAPNHYNDSYCRSAVVGFGGRHCLSAW